MVAIDSRTSSASPFTAHVRALRPTPEQTPVPVVVENASPEGGTVRLPANDLREGDRLVLSVRVAQHHLMDVVAQIVRMEQLPEGSCRAGVEFHPAIPRREFVLLRRVTTPSPHTPPR
ncbi:MAG: PilZ domain-containing protein [Planctomycetaceae bacterium]